MRVTLKWTDGISTITNKLQNAMHEAGMSPGLFPSYMATEHPLVINVTIGTHTLPDTYRTAGEIKLVMNNYWLLRFVERYTDCDFLANEERLDIVMRHAADITPADQCRGSDSVWTIIERYDDDCGGTVLEDAGVMPFDGTYYSVDDLCVCHHCEDYHSTDDAICIDGDYFCGEECARDYGYVMDNEGDWIDQDDACYVAEIGDYVHCDNCYYWESDGEHHMEPEPDVDEYGVYDYHEGPDAVKIGEGDNWIGFEIEKSEIDFDLVGESEESFFAHWEKDSSCGYEGISNIFPLCSWMTLEEIITDSELKLINSGKTNSSCGGHINISGPRITYFAVKEYIALFYAVYRHRLNNTYCQGGKKAEVKSTTKYSTFREKRDGVIEIRLPPAVKSIEQIKFRYTLASHMARAIDENMSWDKFLMQSEPILSMVYNDDKAKEIVQLARDFRAWIYTDFVSPEIKQYV